MKKDIKIELKKHIDNSYPIIISSNIDFAKEIKTLNLNNNYAIITDNIVYKLYRDKIERNFIKEKINFKFIVFNHGEKNKNLKTLKNISEKMLKLGFDRKSTIIALGGGVVGDIAGYVAGTFMRGIPFIQIPTTLLAQVDSSVGGKVAVDLKHGKNTTGLFYQPLKVIIDINYLNTLQPNEFNNGMIEIIKHGIIKDSEYFNSIRENISKISNKSPDFLIELIYKSCIIKGNIVQKDEKENNLRRILNFGHTFGHAFEIISNYKLKHGFAIALGILKESEIAYNLGYLSKTDLSKIEEIMKLFNIKQIKYNKTKLLKIIKNDKKNIKTNKNLELNIPIILPEKIGKVFIKNFKLDELSKTMQ